MRILITGGSNGIGLGVARALAARDEGAHELMLLCRSRERGEATVRALVESSGNHRVSLVLCDLARLADVRAAVEEIHRRHDALDGLFVNAGIGYAAERVETVDGMDAHFQVNYLSHFLLTLGLLDLLERSEIGGRVLFNATQVPGQDEIRWDDLQMVRDWGYEPAIHQAMIAKRMFLLRLHRLYRAGDPPRVSFYGFHVPKAVWTNQLAIIPWPMRTMARLMKLAGRFYSMDECGEIIAPLLTADRAQAEAWSGALLTWKDGAYATMPESAAVRDDAQRERLWRTSLALCGDERTMRVAEGLETG